MKKRKDNSISSGQVLPRDYHFDEARLVTKEMADLLCLDLVGKGLATDSITLHVSYSYRMEKKSAHGTMKLPAFTSSSRQIITHTERLFDRIVDRYVPVRRISVTFNHVMAELYRQYDLFTSPEEEDRERRLQKAILEIKERFGKNAIVRGMDLQEGATTIERKGWKAQVVWRPETESRL